MEKILVIEITKKWRYKMDTSNLKNIVVLKDLPSNLVEEAIVVLKGNQKIEKLEMIDKERKQSNIEHTDKNEVVQNKNTKDYIVKEAQMLIAEYISKMENKNKKEGPAFQVLKKKYKKVRTANYILLGWLILSFLIQFVN